MRFCEKRASVIISNNKVGSLTANNIPNVAGKTVKDFNTIVGIRILRLPETLVVTGNTTTEASLILKHSWGLHPVGEHISEFYALGDPYTVMWSGLGLHGPDTLACRMTVTGNSVRCIDQGCAVDIAPATGYSHETSGDAPYPSNSQTTTVSSLNFANNTVRGGPTDSGNDYHDHLGVVRLWAATSYDRGLTTDSFGKDDWVEGNGLRTPGLIFEIKIHDNIFHASHLYMDRSPQGAGFGAFDDDSAPPLWSHIHSGKHIVFWILTAIAQTMKTRDICGFTQSRGRDYFGFAMKDYHRIEIDFDDITQQDLSGGQAYSQWVWPMIQPMGPDSTGTYVEKNSYYRSHSPLIVMNNTIIFVDKSAGQRRIPVGTRFIDYTRVGGDGPDTID